MKNFLNLSIILFIILLSSAVFATALPKTINAGTSDLDFIFDADTGVVTLEKAQFTKALETVYSKLGEEAPSVTKDRSIKLLEVYEPKVVSRNIDVETGKIRLFLRPEYANLSAEDFVKLNLGKLKAWAATTEEVAAKAEGRIAKPTGAGVEQTALVLDDGTALNINGNNTTVNIGSKTPRARATGGTRQSGTGNPKVTVDQTQVNQTQINQTQPSPENPQPIDDVAAQIEIEQAERAAIDTVINQTPPEQPQVTEPTPPEQSRVGQFWDKLSDSFLVRNTYGRAKQLSQKVDATKVWGTKTTWGRVLRVAGIGYIALEAANILQKALLFEKSQTVGPRVYVLKESDKAIGDVFPKLEGSGNFFIIFKGRETIGATQVLPETMVLAVNPSKNVNYRAKVLSDAMNSPTIGGVITPLLTAFTMSGNMDLGELSKNSPLIEKTGVTYVLVDAETKEIVSDKVPCYSVRYKSGSTGTFECDLSKPNGKLVEGKKYYVIVLFDLDPQVALLSLPDTQKYLDTKNCALFNKPANADMSVNYCTLFKSQFLNDDMVSFKPDVSNELSLYSSDWKTTVLSLAKGVIGGLWGYVKGVGSSAWGIIVGDEQLAENNKLVYGNNVISREIMPRWGSFSKAFLGTYFAGEALLATTVASGGFGATMELRSQVRLKESYDDIMTYKLASGVAIVGLPVIAEFNYKQGPATQDTTKVTASTSGLAPPSGQSISFYLKYLNCQLIGGSPADCLATAQKLAVSTVIPTK